MGRQPFGAANILMGPLSWAALCPSDIWINKEKTYATSLFQKEMNTKQNRIIKVKNVYLWTSAIALAVQFDGRCAST